MGFKIINFVKFANFITVGNIFQENVFLNFDKSFSQIFLPSEDKRGEVFEDVTVADLLVL